MADDARRAQLAASLREVRERIARACAAAGRPAEAVTLTAVTKTYPAGDVLLLAGLGVSDVGENRDQEAAPKAAAARAEGARLRWHFIGRLQRNKVRSVVGYADVVESVDSARLVAALDQAALDRAGLDRAGLDRAGLDRAGLDRAGLDRAGLDRAGLDRAGLDRAGLDRAGLDRGLAGRPPLDVLVQVSLDGAPGRGGAHGDDVWRVSEAVAAAEGLRLRGLMTVAPPDWSPDRAFEQFAGLSARLVLTHPGATVRSAGMSGDLEAAIRHGATHVRIGTSLLGMRNRLR